MRFSEGIKRYNEENKMRIFDEIIAAAEKDNTAEYSHNDNKTAVTGQQKAEDNIMSSTNERARIRSSKGGIVAAACAVLVVGGGFFAAGRMSDGGDVKTIRPGSAYTTDAEDEASADSTEGSEDQTAEDDASSSAETDISKGHKVDNVNSESWRRETDEESQKLIDASDFIGMVQIVNIQKETIDGDEYTDYLCSLIDDEGHTGLVFKYTGDDEIPTRFSIMEKTQAEELLAKGDKILVYAKKGVQSTSGGYSFELTDDLTVFRWNNQAHRYLNVYRPGDIGDLINGLYESGLETYYTDILFWMCGDNDFDAAKNWCEYYGLPFNVSVEPGHDSPEGAIIEMIWPNDAGEGVDPNGITVRVSDGLSYTGENDKVEEEQKATELNVRDKGTTIKEFADYDMELGGLYYEEEDNTYGVVIDVTRKDGSAFSHDEWVNNHMDLVYGDVQPIMELTESYMMESGLSWLTEDDKTMRVACVFHADKLLSEVNKDVPVTLQVNTVRRENGEEEEGLFEVKFNIDITDVK